MGKYGFGPLADAPIEGTGKILFSEEVVQTRVEELAKEITKDYEGEEPVLIGVLRGVVVFMADLMRSIDLDLQIEFMEITHYGEETDGGIEVLRDSLTELKGKHVIIVEDIVDTGLTLRYLVEHLQAKEPASIKICTLLDKPVRRMAGIPIGYVGFEIPDEFLVGYGLDYMGKFRNLPHLAILNRTEPKAVPQR
ncbi:MAG: hypoxanthine phosphoribosyltransferase [Chloroflexi bacterium]|nr:hypoxanthine phosphoribosyltransferase [Chloroflexota bacterium]MBD86577.1 hypoxanthine phosphoribosyltransferase [Chloroflexota bacterium]HCH36048.1 hypoxanthine phosphoribosyltransferase [Dehalococcoidia bacterium]